MILLYPMLTSKSVSTNILPGICKLLERYLLVHSMNKILSAAGLPAMAAHLSKMENENLLEYDPNKKKYDSPPNQPALAAPPQDRKPENRDNKQNNISVDIPKDNWGAVSIEPTWITVKGVLGQEQMVGVKVVPFPINASSNVVDILTRDKASGVLRYLAARYGRMILRFTMMLAKATKAPGISSGVSGDPHKDILWGFGKSGLSEVFVCLNKLDFNESNVLDKPSTVNQLFRMGWDSIIVADDVNKEATFCMKNFSGLCSTTPYGFIYSTLGGGHGKVFDTISDVKKSSAPFFHKGTRLSSVISEAVAARKMSDMLIKKKKREVIVEDVNNFVTAHKSSILQKIKDVKHAIDKNDIGALSLATVDLPKAPIENMVREREVHDNYNYAKRVLKNSVDLSDTAIHYAASMFSLAASKTDDSIATTKQFVKEFVNKVSGKTGMDLIKAVLAFGWAGVVLKLVYNVARDASIVFPKAFNLSQIFGFLTKQVPKIVVGNYVLLIALLSIYIVAEIVQHIGDKQDE